MCFVEKMFFNRRIVDWVLRIFVAVMLLQTLFFKFTGAEESVYIFSNLGIEAWGRYVSGILELISAVLILLPSTVLLGALFVVLIMSGAIISHLAFLGVEVMGDGGLLFGMAVFVLLISLRIIWLRKDEFKSFLSNFS